MPGASRSIVVNAPPEKVYDIVINYDRYPEWLTEVKKISTSERKGSEVKVHYEVDLKIKTIRYTILAREERPNRMSWSFVEGEVSLAGGVLSVTTRTSSPTTFLSLLGVGRLEATGSASGELRRARR